MFLYYVLEHELKLITYTFYKPYLGTGHYLWLKLTLGQLVQALKFKCSKF